MTDNPLSRLLPQAGALSKTAWDLPQNMTETDWKQAGAALSRVEGALMWWIGDWWAFGEHKYGERKALVESDEWEGPVFDTCQRAGQICRTFEPRRRRLVVPFGHHREVASLPADEADKILDWCEATQEEHGRLPTRKATRDRVKQVKAWLAQGWTTDQLERKAMVEEGLAVVASKRKNDDGKERDAALIAWADQQGLMVEIQRGTAWGNPFEMPADGDRDRVCDLYAEHYLPFKGELHRKLPTLAGKVLVCWCHPERCHGDELASLANMDDVP